MLRLLSVAEAEPGDLIWDAGAELAGDGFYAVNLRVSDLHALLPRLEREGVDIPGDPYFWEVSEEVAVWDSMSRDRDGVFLDLFAYQRGGELRGELAGEVSVVQTIAIATHDVERCREFYGKLGFDVLFDLHLEGLEELLHVPPGISIHNVNMMKDGEIVPGRVECFRYHGEDLPPAYPLRDRAAPPRRGILAATLETVNLTASDLELQAAGAVPISDSVETDLPGYGPIRLRTYFGPDGECLEVIETPKTG